jgi:poly-gamma-glutamate synthase PgsB/CapB
MTPLRPPRRPLPPGAASLAALVDPLTARVRGDELTWLAERVEVHAPPLRRAEGLVAAAHACRAARSAVTRRADALRSHAADATGASLTAVLARHLRETVPEGSARNSDLRALRRDLDLDALLEREAGRAEREGARLEVAVRALGGLCVEGLDAHASEQVGALSLLATLATEEPRPPTRRAAVRALADVTAAQLQRQEVPDPRGLATLQGIARDTDDDPWCRRAALRVVAGLDGPIALRWLGHALGAVDGREPWLIRAAAMTQLLDHPSPGLLALAEQHLDDPAELVRFALADGLGRRWRRGDEAAGHLLVRWMGEHPAPRTRARAVAAAGRLALNELGPRLRDVPLVADFALDILHDRPGTALPAEVADALHALAREGAPPIARRAALALQMHQARPHDVDALVPVLTALRPGATLDVACPAAGPVALAEALLPAAARGHGFWLAPRGNQVRVTRGDPMAPRLWRLLHELRHPSPSKRQTLSHVLGRVDAGAIRVPPTLLQEESATGVPGERVRVGREEGWGPGLPDVDAYLNATGRAQVVIVAPEGVTTVVPPARWLDRLRAAWTLTWRYADYDQMRRSALAEGEDRVRGRYVRAMAALGFRTATTALADGPWASLYTWAWLDPVAYALSLKSNTLAHLAAWVTVLLLVLMWRATTVTSTIRGARHALPLVIGGWGTRGKSGTERLKAGLFEGLGIPVLSKTTGCEAMVLHAPPGGHATELFLFRAYDRATIWEQVQVLELARRLDARALLWECMALNPLYVDLLQTRWMQDDLSTLTNAYPDHEDIMGPSGMDVARVIGTFSPRDATVWTTEDNLFAELDEVARSRGATLRAVPRVARELVATELMDRMPHVEHPANVALAATIGTALGLDPTEAIGWMGEHVVPDLGALSVSPPARHLGRELTFTNGMSANDTLSFRHNWRRTGFADHDPVADPATWVVTVINNRADRVARSRVFAQVCAEDAAAHRHVLIGTNVRGFLTYHDEAVAHRLAATVLGTPERVDALFAHLRLVEPGALGEACGARLGAPAASRRAWARAVAALPPGPASWPAARTHAAALRGAAEALAAACTEPAAGLADALIDAAARHQAAQAARTAPDAAIRSLYAELARASFIVVEDAHATGDQVIGRVVAACPPGTAVRVLGVQNIKGTGLDFAYQWVYWRELAKSLVDLLSDRPDRRQRGLSAVEAHPFGSAMACDEALGALGALSGDPEVGARVRRATTRIAARRDALMAARRAVAPRRGLWQVALQRLERLLDPLDAVWRAQRARRVFADLARGQISHPKAQAWLVSLTARQKGGWLLRRGRSQP